LELLFKILDIDADSRISSGLAIRVMRELQWLLKNSKTDSIEPLPENEIAFKENSIAGRPLVTQDEIRKAFK